MNSVYVHDIMGDRLVASFEWLRQEPRRVLFSPDGSTLVVVAGSVLRVWDIQGGKPVADVNGGKKHFMGAVFTPDGRFVVTVSKDHTTRLWDTGTWNEARAYDWDIGQLLDVAAWPGGQVVAVASDKGQVLLFDVD